MKSQKPDEQHIACRKALEDVIRISGANLGLDALELLAIFSHMVGQLMALQDQQSVTPAMAIAVVQSNIEQGYKDVIDGLLNSETRIYQ